MNDFIIMYINMKYVQKYQSGPRNLDIFPCAAFVKVQDKQYRTFKSINQKIKTYAI